MADSPRPPDDGAARHLTPGIAIPDIALPAAGGGALSPAAISGIAVVYCYTWTGRPGLPDPPQWDDIPGAHGSTPQTEAFRDLHPRFEAAGVEIFGLSAQASDYQREMVTRLGVPFPVLSDAGLEFARALALPTFETGGVTYLKRLTLVIEDGLLLRCFYPVHPPATHPRDLLEWILARRNSRST